MPFAAEYISPLGPLKLVSKDGEALAELRFPGEQTEATSMAMLPLFVNVCQWLDAYFARTPLPIDFPLAPEGTPFCKRIWRQLLQIPYGTTVTYKELAIAVQGVQHACPQAVGQAVSRNPIPIIIPCHRVIGTRGKLVGFSLGLAVKQQLLQHEGIFL